MADLQKTSQVVGQVLTQDTGKQKASQIVGQVLSQDTGLQKASQIVGQILYIDEDDLPDETQLPVVFIVT